MFYLTQDQWNRWLKNFQKAKKTLVQQLASNNLDHAINKKYAIYAKQWEWMKENSMRVKDM